jgi:hypothetical protein
MKRPVRRLVSWLLYGGSYTLRDYESRILNFVRASLRPEDQSALDLQLDDLDQLKRAHQGRMVTFFYLSPKTVPKLSNIVWGRFLLLCMPHPKTLEMPHAADLEFHASRLQRFSKGAKP